MDAEIIEFTRPLENEKNLYVTNIPRKYEECELYEILERIFSRFGLLYEIQVIAIPQSAAEIVGPAEEDKVFSGYYAFVKFYSTIAASKAKKELTGRLYLRGQHLKLQFARRKAVEASQVLYVSKCYDLANYYLGFNAWPIQLIKLDKCEVDESEVSPENGTRRLNYVGVVKLELPKHGLHADGVAIATEFWNQNEPDSRGVAICKAKKRAYSRAVENAFSKIVLVYLTTGKVHVEVNTTAQDQLQHNQYLSTDSLIKVNEMDFASGDNSEDESVMEDCPPGTCEDQDEDNMHILAQLAEDNFE